MYILYPFRSYISIANTMLSDSIIYVLKFIKQNMTFSRFYLKYLSNTCIVYFLQDYGFVHWRTICQCLVSFVKRNYALIFPKMYLTKRPSPVIPLNLSAIAKSHFNNNKRGSLKIYVSYLWFQLNKTFSLDEENYVTKTAELQMLCVKKIIKIKGYVLNNRIMNISTDKSKHVIDLRGLRGSGKFENSVCFTPVPTYLRMTTSAVT